MKYIVLFLTFTLVLTSNGPIFCMQPSPEKQTTTISKTCAIADCKKESCKAHCGQCKKIYYCSREHQIKDWPTHKPLCKPVESASSNLATVVERRQNYVDQEATTERSAATADKQTATVEDCIICCYPLSTQEVRLQCNHNNFHAHCIAKWTFNKTKPLCPLCNQPMEYLKLQDQDNKEQSTQLTNNKVQLVQPDGTVTKAIVEIEGSAQKILGVKNLWESSQLHNIPIVIMYIRANGPREGAIYYAKTKRGSASLIHESWVHPADRYKLKNIE